MQREAQDAATLRSSLKAEGCVVLDITPFANVANVKMLPIANANSQSGTGNTGNGNTGNIPHAFQRFTISTLSVEMGLRQISAMLRSGIPLLVTLGTVAAQSPGKGAQRMWRTIAAMIEKGDSLSTAFAAFPRQIGEIAVRLAEVGEKTGELSRTLSRAADQMEVRRSLRALVVNALAYPALAVIMAVAVSAYLVVAVIPKLADFLRTGGVALPAITQALMDVSDFARTNSPEIAAAVMAAAAVWLGMRLFARSRELQDALLLRLPVTGRILRLSGTAVFARSMQIMTEAGVTLIDALETSAKLLSNHRLRRRIDDASAAVVRGSTLDDALSQAVEFMPMMRPMAAVGEVSGSLPDAFDQTARFHELLLALAVKRFGMLIEPIMIIITGAIVGFVYIAFFVALFSIAATH